MCLGKSKGRKYPEMDLDVSSRHAACGRGVTDGGPVLERSFSLPDTQRSMHCLDISWIAFLGGNMG